MSSNIINDRNVYGQKQEILKYIKDYIQQRNEDYHLWSIGICQEIHEITLELMKLSSSNWLSIKTESPQTANDVVDYLVNTIGIQMSIYSNRQNINAALVFIHKPRISNT